MTTNKSAKLPTLELAALAFAAYRKNANLVHNQSQVFDKVLDMLVPVTPNKTLMQSSDLQVVEQDKVDAQAAIDLLSQERMIKILKGARVPDFQNTLTDLTMQPNCMMRDSGLMAYLPSMAEQVRQRQEREQAVAELALCSEYLGKVGDKITVTIEVLKSHYVSKYNCWSVSAKDEQGNLISYLTGKEECTKSGRYSGKIKRTETSSYHNGARVTTLNFVKFA